VSASTSAGADRKSSLQRVEARIVRCRLCPRLVEYRERIGREKRRAFRDHTYWARPVPGFGDPAARLVVVGLAPAAHGGNRTGRVFTGDRSGDWLYRAMHRAGFANQPLSVSRDDGLELRRAYVTAAARCAPPDNKPTPEELTSCRGYLVEELAVLRSGAGARKPLVVLALGAIALGAALGTLEAIGIAPVRPRPRFGHAAEYRVADDVVLLCSYHPSQQNTQTGVLTEAMLDRVFARARELVGRAK
jgi:uracil-DNA glycosylase family 4